MGCPSSPHLLGAPGTWGSRGQCSRTAGGQDRAEGRSPPGEAPSTAQHSTAWEPLSPQGLAGRAGGHSHLWDPCGETPTQAGTEQRENSVSYIGLMVLPHVRAGLAAVPDVIQREELLRHPPSCHPRSEGPHPGRQGQTQGAPTAAPRGQDRDSSGEQGCGCRATRVGQE